MVQKTLSFWQGLVAGVMVDLGCISFQAWQFWSIWLLEFEGGKWWQERYYHPTKKLGTWLAGKSPFFTGDAHLRPTTWGEFFASPVWNTDENLEKQVDLQKIKHKYRIHIQGKTNCIWSWTSNNVQKNNQKLAANAKKNLRESFESPSKEN